MINLNSGNKYSYQQPQQYTGDTVGIMSSTMPGQGLPNGATNKMRPFASTKREVDMPAYMEVQQQARNQNRRVTFDEFVGTGNDPTKYGELDAYYKSVGMAAPAADPSDPYSAVYENQRQQNYTQANVDAQANRIQEYNPYGSSEYITNADGTVSRVSQLSQPNQQLLDQQYYQDNSRNNALGGMLDQYAQNYKPISQDYSGEASRAENSAYDRYSRDLNQNFDRQQESLRNQLVNSGASIGSEKYTRAMQDLERSKSDAFMNARDQSISAGQTQGNYLMNQELQRRQVPLSEMSAIQAGVRGPQSPSFSQNYNVQMPYMDTASASVDNQNQLAGWAREDKLRAEAEAKAKKNGGGGGRSSGGNNQASAFDNQLMQMALQAAGSPRPQQANPFLQGLVNGGSQGLGQGISGLFTS